VAPPEVPGSAALAAGRTRPRRVLFVFAWLVVGGEETEVRLLAKHLDPARYRLDVVACLRRPGMPEQTHAQLAALGIPVDRALYAWSFEETVAYLAERLPAYDLVVSCQGVPDVYPALERCREAPPLIEHGGLVTEALAGPKHYTARYVGVCRAIRDAAASRMPERPQHALVIPSMVDLAEFRPRDRAAVRREWGAADATPVIAWVGRLDRKKRVEDVMWAFALLAPAWPEARLVIVGGADAFMPEYADELRGLAVTLGLMERIAFLGDRADVPRLLAGCDALVWLSEGEGLPHVLLEAGAACRPVVATSDIGAGEIVADGVTGLSVPPREPAAVARALARLLADPPLRRRLGANLRQLIEREYSAAVVVPRWEALFAKVIDERERHRAPALPDAGNPRPVRKRRGGAGPAGWGDRGAPASGRARG
jgi:glycosyltransferase involved in cell wall biosynthesis